MTRLKLCFSLLLLTGAAGILHSCTPHRATPQINVILITVDTLRADHLGCYGNPSVETPSMDALAHDGVLFSRAIAQVPLTAPSHAAILTGTYPLWNGMRDWADHGLQPGIPTLAEIFKAHGYTTAAFVSAFVLDSMWGLGRGFDLYDDRFKAEERQPAPRRALERRGEETVDHSLAWLQSPRSRPFFLWLHLYDPHAPYDPPEPFKTRFRGRLYDGEVAYADRQVGRFFDFLKTHDLYASSLIVLTSDHGEGLGDHQEQDHGFFIYDSTVHVPLLLKFPAGHAPVRTSVPEVVNTVDIAPTLLRLSGFPDTDARTFQGQSLLSLVGKGSAAGRHYGFAESVYARTLLGSHVLFGLQTERYHYIQAPQEELYDVAQDPAERRNIVREAPNVVQELRQAVLDIRARFQRGAEATGQSPSLDPEVVAKLRSLGYVSLSPARHPSDDDPATPDPKDGIGAYNEMVRARLLSESGQFQEAKQLVAALAASHPRAHMFAFLQGENCLAMGDAQEAITHFRRALELNPTFDQAAIGLAGAAARVGRNDEAAKAYQLALQLNPNDFMSRLALARVYWRLRQPEAAAREQLEALRTHSEFPQANADYGMTLVQMRKPAAAVPPLQKGIELGYRDAMAYDVLGNALAALGRIDEARRAYEQAISLDPSYTEAYANLSVLCLGLGQREEAEKYFQAACRLDASVCQKLAPRFR